MLDSRITKTHDFRIIIKSNIKNMFNFSYDLFNTRVGCVYIDMNSVMSILFNYDKLNDVELVSDITEIFENFIDAVVSSGTKAKFLYTGKPSLVHSTVYSGWCAKRYERVNIKNSEFILRFLSAMKKFGEKNKLLECVNIGDKHPAQYIVENSTYIRGDIYIVSKDYVVQTLINNIKAVIFTGINYIDYRDTSPTLYNGVNPHEYLPKGYEWVFPVIMGDVRNEYKGVLGYGPRNTLKYIEKNRIKIIAERDHDLSVYLKEHKCLYDVMSLIAKYQELSTPVE